MLASRHIKSSAVKRAQHRQVVKQERFNWEKQWYPVAVTADLDPSRPRAITLLGQRLVLWRAKDGAWQCFDDRCPHRLAPLSGALARLLGLNRGYDMLLLIDVAECTIAQSAV